METSITCPLCKNPLEDCPCKPDVLTAPLRINLAPEEKRAMVKKLTALGGVQKFARRAVLEALSELPD